MVKGLWHWWYIYLVWKLTYTNDWGESKCIRNQILHELRGKKQTHLAKNLHRITRFVVSRLNCMQNRCHFSVLFIFAVILDVQNKHDLFLYSSADMLHFRWDTAQSHSLTLDGISVLEQVALWFSQATDTEKCWIPLWSLILSPLKYKKGPA